MLQIPGLEVNVTREESVVGRSVQVTWLVTYLHAPFDLPPLLLSDGDDLLEDASVDVERRVEANGLGGGFMLHYGEAVTGPLPHDASAEAVADAIRSLPTFRHEASGT